MAAGWGVGMPDSWLELSFKRSSHSPGPTLSACLLSALSFLSFYLIIWLCWVLRVACAIHFPDQGSNPGPLHWKHRVLATGSPGKSLHFTFSVRPNLTVLLKTATCIVSHCLRHPHLPSLFPLSCYDFPIGFITS